MNSLEDNLYALNIDWKLNLLSLKTWSSAYWVTLRIASVQKFPLFWLER